MTIWLLLSILLTGQLMGCIRQPFAAANYSEDTVYRPSPTMEVSMFMADDRVVSAVVRHSGGCVLLHLSAPDASRYEIPVSDVDAALTLSFADKIPFRRTYYEGFVESYDMFGDGRIVLVPLSEQNRKVAGVFINLLSGQRYFLAPTVQEPQSVARIRALAGKWPDITVIEPEDRRIGDRVARFPEFRR
jgi:hypothetical protein